MPIFIDQYIIMRRWHLFLPERWHSVMSWRVVHLTLCIVQYYQCVYCDSAFVCYVAFVDYPATRIHPVLFQCWASVEGGGPTLKQHWVNALSFLGMVKALIYYHHYIDRPRFLIRMYRLGLVTWGYHAGSNPGRDGYLSSWLCIYSAPNCSKAVSVKCCLWYCAL